MRPSWSGSSSSSGVHKYGINLSCNFFWDYIKPGEKKNFDIITYLPTTNHIVVAGERFGQGALQTWGWQPSSPGDSFLGPVGAIEKRLTGSGAITNAPYLHAGADAVFGIEAAAGHAVTGIRTNGVSIGELPRNLSRTNYTWRVPSSGSIEAVFEPKTYTLTVISEHDGQPVGNPAGTGVYTHGQSATSTVDRIHWISSDRRLRARQPPRVEATE